MNIAMAINPSLNFDGPKKRRGARHGKEFVVAYGGAIEILTIPNSIPLLISTVKKKRWS